MVSDTNTMYHAAFAGTQSTKRTRPPQSEKTGISVGTLTVTTTCAGLSFVSIDGHCGR